MTITASLKKGWGELCQNLTLANANRQTALIDINLQYQKVIERSMLDITLVKANYANTMRSLKTITYAITHKYNQLQAVEKMQVSKHSILNAIEGLKEQLNSAQIGRLYNEFNHQETIVVSPNIACNRDEALTNVTNVVLG